jgi:hypothetical protein
MSTWDSARSTPPPFGSVCECFHGGFWWACVVEALDSRLSQDSGSLRPAAAALLARLPAASPAARADRKRGRDEPASPMYRVRVLADCPAAEAAAAAGAAAAGERAGFPPPLAAAAALRAVAGCSDTWTLLPPTQLRPLGWAMHAQLAARAEPEEGGSGGGGGGGGAPAPAPPPRGVPPSQWAKRSQLWRRWEEGVRMDVEGWRSVTPEAAALHMAAQAAAAAHGGGGGGGPLLVLDAFAGWGGNAIAFARRGARVVAMEASLPRLRLAQHNAGVYAGDVAAGGGGITWVHGDAREVLAALAAAAAAGCGGAELATALAALAASSGGGGGGGGGVGVGGGGGGGGEPLDGASLAAAVRALAPPRSGMPAPPLLDVAFLAPPWGGSSYKDSGRGSQRGGERGYSLARHLLVGGGGEAVSGDALLRLAARAGVARVVQAYLPKHTALAGLRGALLGLPAEQEEEGPPAGLVPVRWVDLPPGGCGDHAAAAVLPLAGAGAELDVALLGVGGHALGLFATLRQPSPPPPPPLPPPT